MSYDPPRPTRADRPRVGDVWTYNPPSRDRYGNRRSGRYRIVEVVDDTTVRIEPEGRNPTCTDS